jgi:uncharacterized protein YneF (UPF0154 family)
MKTWIKILTALFLLGIIAGILGYFFIYNKPHKDYLKAKPELSLSAAELYSAFVENPSEAAPLYNGKVIKIDGNLDDFEVSGDMAILVFIFDDGMFGPEGVRCTMLPEMYETVMSLTIGDYIQLKGLCTGYTGVDVILDKCSIVE